MKHRSSVVLVAAFGLASALAQAAEPALVETSVVDHGNGHYTLSTLLSGTTDPAHGQLAIVPTAEELCGDRYPRYGHYEFESNAPADANEAAVHASLRYIQDIECSDTLQMAPEATSAPVPPAPSTPPTQADAALIRARTLAYLEAKIAANAGNAYTMFSAEMASYATPEAWADALRTFNAQAGPGARAAIVRITWYDDPEGAPTPGRYVAADYRVDYPSDAVTCGYVIWVRQADGGYLIAREETGQATPDTTAGLTPEQKLALRAQLQCRD